MSGRMRGLTACFRQVRVMCPRSFHEFWQIGQESGADPTVLLERSECGQVATPDFLVTLCSSLSGWIQHIPLAFAFSMQFPGAFHRLCLFHSWAA